MALGSEEIDAAGFTLIRLASGAVVLAAMVLLSKKTGKILSFGHWTSAFFLFAYAICFSFAYLGLTAGTGALILFTFVQLTMITAGIVMGERPTIFEWTGFAVALAGLVYLLLPGLAAPPIFSSALMAAAGIAWGFYTIRGRTSSDPLAETAGNFVRAVPMIFVAVLPFIGGVHVSARGALLAILSGAVASGLGYSIWYSALKYHTATRAALLQLSVPLITALGGILLLSEKAGVRLLVASAMILGGIGLSIAFRRPVPRGPIEQDQKA
jgi:drug/metabolite transporter (DMT)-like permease